MMFWSPENEGQSMPIIMKDNFIAETAEFRTRIVLIYGELTIEDFDEMARRTIGNVKIAVSEYGQLFGIQHRNASDYSENSAGNVAIRQLGELGPIETVIHIVKDLTELPLYELSKSLTHSGAHYIYTVSGSYKFINNVHLLDVLRESDLLANLDIIFTEVLSKNDLYELCDMYEKYISKNIDSQLAEIIEYVELYKFVEAGKFTLADLNSLTEDQETTLFKILSSIDANKLMNASQVLKNKSTISDTFSKLMISIAIKSYDVDRVLEFINGLILTERTSKESFEKDFANCEMHRQAIKDVDDEESIPRRTLNYLMFVLGVLFEKHTKMKDSSWANEVRNMFIRRRFEARIKANACGFLDPISSEDLLQLLTPQTF